MVGNPTKSNSPNITTVYGIKFTTSAKQIPMYI